MASELEIKLLIGADDLDYLLKSPLITDVTIEGSIRTDDLFSVYYDTPTHKLMKSGIVYRVRKNGNEFEATIKTDKKCGGGFSERNEYNLPLQNSEPVLEGFSELGFNVDLKALIGEDELIDLFAVAVKRELRLLKVSEETVLEMAIDRGFVRTYTDIDPIDETELEIKTGKKEDLLKFTAQVAELVPAYAEDCSKFERGLILLGLAEKRTGEKKRFAVNVDI